MKPNSKLASAIQSSGFIVTAEYLPPPAADGSVIKAGAELLGNSLAAVSIADNHSGIGMSSIAASSVFLGLGREPIYQVVTRDRNRIAIQSDLLGAVRPRHQERPVHVGPSPDPHRMLRFGQRLRPRRDPGRGRRETDA